MALKIVTAAEPIIVKNIKLVIYGDAGLGKTSLGYSAKNPLLIDFDKGAHRTSHRNTANHDARTHQITRLS